MRINIKYSPENGVMEFAAEELARYLSALELKPVCICNGKGEHSIELLVAADMPALGLAEAPDPELDDRYCIEIANGGGKIAASNPRSVLLGVYGYLTRLGFRFLCPGESGTRTPRIAAAEQLSVSCRASAALRHRGVCIEGADSLENVLDYIDWLPKLGCNSFFLQFRDPDVFFDRWYSHESNPLLPPAPLSAEAAALYSQRVSQALTRRGLLHHRVGHGWTRDAINLPTDGWQVYTSEIPDDTLALLAEIDGKRQLRDGVPTNTNLCYSNPNAQERLINAVVGYAKEHPEVNYLHVWLADGHNNICECAVCAQTTPSDQYVAILNRIDEELTRAGLSTKLVFLLYQELLFAPIRERLTNPSRFTLMFAPISRTFEQSYPVGPLTVTPPEYHRNQMVMPVNIEENLAYLRQWQKCFTGDSFDYDYPLGRAHYGDLGYYSLSRIISEDIRALPKLGLNGYISCQELRAAFPNALPNYVMGRLLFSDELSFDELCREYYLAAYGGEGERVLAYLRELSSLCSCDYFNGKGPRLRPELAEKLRQALRLVKEFAPVIAAQSGRTGCEKLFWELLDYHSQYAGLLLEALAALAEGDPSADNLFEKVVELIRRRETEFQPYFDVFRVIEVATRYAGFSLRKGLDADV